MAGGDPRHPGWQQPYQQPPAQQNYYYQQPYHGAHNVSQVPVETNHVFHLLATVFTCGLWFPVWMIMWAVNTSRKRKVTSTTHHW